MAAVATARFCLRVVDSAFFSSGFIFTRRCVFFGDFMAQKCRDLTELVVHTYCTYSMGLSECQNKLNSCFESTNVVMGCFRAVAII